MPAYARQTHAMYPGSMNECPPPSGIFNGPERVHNMAMNEKNVTAWFNSPVDRSMLLFTKSLTSSEIRWSGLSVFFSVNCHR